MSLKCICGVCCFFQAEDGIRDLVRSRGLGDVYKRQDGSGRPTPPWPAEMSDETEKGTDEINAWFQQQSLSLIHI